MEIIFNLKCFLITIVLFCLVIAQQPEIPDQYDKTTSSELPSTTTEAAIELIVNNVTVESTTEPKKVARSLITTHLNTKPEVSVYSRLSSWVTQPIITFVKTPKVNSVLRNIATCVVNGVMELVSFYFPAPLIPIIASLAGIVAPFEPVLMLRDRMPVTSYRRAFITAMNTFLGTFDKYKLDDNYAYDPYMMQRFNRRMMNYAAEETTAKVDDNNKE